MRLEPSDDFGVISKSPRPRVEIERISTACRIVRYLLSPRYPDKRERVANLGVNAAPERQRLIHAEAIMRLIYLSP
jgi:hypothetical protein